MTKTNLIDLGTAFAALMEEYTATKASLSALQHEADRTAADVGVVYGSSAWSAHRFAVTGPAVRRVNELYMQLEGLAEAIESYRPACFAGLLIKVRAHQFTGNSAAIITEIEALAEAGNQEAA